MRRALFFAKRSHNRDKFGFSTNLRAAKARRTPGLIGPDDRSLWKGVILWTVWRAVENISDNNYIIDIVL